MRACLQVDMRACIHVTMYTLTLLPVRRLAKQCVHPWGERTLAEIKAHAFALDAVLVEGRVEGEIVRHEEGGGLCGVQRTPRVCQQAEVDEVV